MDKAPDAFRTISEVADEINVPQHVLRFWESRFSQIRPMKRGGGRRYYRPDDVDLLRGIRHLLYGEGYTIRGVQRILREEGASFVQDVWRAGAAPPPPPAAEDAAEADGDATPETARAEPDFPLSDFSPPVAGRRSVVERREPTLTALGGAGKPAALDKAFGDKLRAVIGDLTECRRLIDAALQDAALPQD